MDPSKLDSYLVTFGHQSVYDDHEGFFNYIKLKKKHIIGKLYYGNESENIDTSYYFYERENNLFLMADDDLINKMHIEDSCVIDFCVIFDNCYYAVEMFDFRDCEDVGAMNINSCQRGDLKYLK